MRDFTACAAIKRIPRHRRDARWRRKVTTIHLTLLAIAATLGVVVASPVHASGAVQCQILLGKATPDSKDIAVTAEQCAPAGSVLARPAASVLIMTWFDGYDFSGNSTNVYQDSGFCTYAGAGISNVGAAWNDRIRSWRIFNGCWDVATFSDHNYGGICTVYSGQNPSAIWMDVTITAMWISSAGGRARSTC